MRVLRISERIPPLAGGKEIHVQELTRRSVAMGDDVHLAYRLGDPGAAASTRISLPTPLDSWSTAPRSAVFAAAAAFRLRHRAADVIHLHGDFPEVPPLAALARHRRIPLVLTVHGGLNLRLKHLARPALRGVDKFIALGAGVADDLRSCGAPVSRIRVMSSGIDLARIDQAAHGVVREPGLVVAVGSLDPVKNIETLVRAVADLPASSAVRLEVIGAGPEQARLQQIAAGADRVRFLGQQSRDAVYRRLAAADLFVIASRRLGNKAEGVPTALLEAMALRRACLVSEHASPRPVVTDDSAYASFDPNDAGRLAALIQTYLADPAESAAMGERARRAVAGLDWDLNAQRIRDVLREAIAERGERREVDARP